MTQSLPPSPDNDYQFPPAPNRAVLDRAVWAAVMASIGGRLRDLEAQRIELADVIADLRLFGLERLNEAVEPLIVQTQQRLDGLDADLAILRGQIDTILSGVVPAGIVAESEARVFVSPEQRAEIAKLREELDAAKVADIDPGLMAAGRALRVRRATKADLDTAKAEGKLKVGELVLVTDEGALAMALATNEYVYAAPVAASGEEAAAAENTLKYMTPSTTKKAINSYGRMRASHEIFTQSANFAKDPRDVFYLVEIIDGGSGGSGGVAYTSSGSTSLGAGGGSGGFSFFGTYTTERVNEKTPSTLSGRVAGGVGGASGAASSAADSSQHASKDGASPGGGGGGQTSRPTTSAIGRGVDGAGDGGTAIASNSSNDPAGTSGHGKSAISPGGGGGGGYGYYPSGSIGYYGVGGSGGAGGARANWFLTADSLPSDIPIIIGAGGAGGQGGSVSGRIAGNGGNGYRGEIRVWRFRA